MSYLGIDIGGTRVKVGVVAFNGKIIKSEEFKTPTDLDDFKKKILDIVQIVLRSIDQPKSVGIGCKGVINTNTTEVITLPGKFKFLEGINLSTLVSVALPTNISIVADNDAHAALAGEVVWGVAKDLENVIMLTLGTGVGGGILANGYILKGKTGVAGHFGHITINPYGPLCSCGNFGCLETFFSALAIEAEALSGVHRGCESILTERYKNSIENISCKAIFEVANEGDLLASSIINKAIKYLASGITGLAHVFDPELIILGGQISEAGESLFRPLEIEFWNRSSRLLKRKIPIVKQQINDTSGIIGAAALSALSERYK